MSVVALIRPTEDHSPRTLAEHRGRHDLSVALNLLGPCAEAVAYTLRERRMTGERHCPAHCPVAHWVHHVTGMTVSVGNDALTVVDGPLAGMSVRLPDAVRSFVVDHDAGLWPQLAVVASDDCLAGVL